MKNNILKNHSTMFVNSTLKAVYVLLAIIGTFMATQSKADYLDLSVGAIGDDELGIIWNGYPGGVYKIKVKKGSSIV